MIQIRDLAFAYPEGDFRLDIAELSVARGASVAVVGSSGTGKTTLLNLISGVSVPESGTVVTNDVALADLSDGRRRQFRLQNIGFIFQEFELLDYLSVLDNILLSYRISSGLSLTSEVRERARMLADRVGIGDKLGRKMNHLSQGERQRGAICRALLPAPALLLADEPTGNLDSANTQRVLDIVFDYVESSQATLVCVTHDQSLLGRFEQVVNFEDFKKEATDA